MSRFTYRGVSHRKTGSPRGTQETCRSEEFTAIPPWIFPGWSAIAARRLVNGGGSRVDCDVLHLSVNRRGTQRQGRG